MPAWRRDQRCAGLARREMAGIRGLPLPGPVLRKVRFYSWLSSEVVGELQLAEQFADRRRQGCVPIHVAPVGMAGLLDAMDGVDAAVDRREVQMKVAESMTALRERLKNGRVDTARVAPMVEILAIGEFRQAPETAPDSRRWSLPKQELAASVAQNHHETGFDRYRLAGLGRGKLGGAALRQRYTFPADRAVVASGVGSGANRGAQIHHRLGVVTDPLDRRQALGKLPQPALHRCIAGPAFDALKAGQNPFDVAVENGSANAKGYAQNRAGGGTADARQRSQLSQDRWQFTPVLLADDDRGAVQVSGPCVIPEPRPIFQNGACFRAGQAGQVGKSFSEPQEIGNDRRHLGLLQHDFGHPDSIRVGGLLPGQMLAAVLVEPGEDGLLK